MPLSFFSGGLAADEPTTPPTGDPLWWLREQGPLVRRFVLAELLGPPPGFGGRGRAALPRRLAPPPLPEPGEPAGETGE